MPKRFALPIRTRLTLWYTASLGLILLLFATYLYLQLRHNLLAQLDIGLDVLATQALLNIRVENERLAFQNMDHIPQTARLLNDDFMVYLVTPDGELWDQLGREPDAPVWDTPAAGYVTLTNQGELWRVYSREVNRGRVTGWLQVVRELEPTLATLQSLRTQILWGLPLAWLLAGIGGFFLAGRALRPIDRITRTAQAIQADELQQRIGYIGPADEVGRLAATLDAMLDRLQSAFARERRFTGDAAHELRTPLTTLKGRLEVTLSQPRPRQAYIETLQEMEGQVNRLIRLSNDLLFMARLDKGQIPLHQETIQVQDFLGSVVDQIRPLAAAKAITLTETIPPELTLHGDMDLLLRLFLNLLDNAVKYTPKNGHITITAEQNQAGLHIAVQDSGPGIPAAHLPHLFERFYRVETDRSRTWEHSDAGGTGLGLAIAYDIVRAHGGAIHVTTPVQNGLGSMFVVQFPLPAHDASSVSAASLSLD